ncbi:MAG: heavy metal translocating P-type ATPase [SAR324 cluster bacterium]|nr:heavy metal translocating P-type ATPase [SAR324 cluster bacterium]
MISGLIVLAVCGGALFLTKPRKASRKRIPEDTRQNSQKELIVSRNKAEQEASRDFNISTAALITAMISKSIPGLLPVSLPLLFYTSFPVFKGAVQSFVEKKKIGNDAIVSSTILICFALKEYTTVALGAWFYFLGNKIIVKVKDQSKERYVKIFKQQSSKVWALKDGVEIQMPLDELDVGDVIVVGPGENIPVDGIIINGQAQLTQQALIGESWPAEKSKGDFVFASTAVLTGRIVIRIQKTEKEVLIAKIDQILNSTEDFKTRLDLKGNEWADWGALPIMSLSGLTWLLMGPTASVVVLSSHFGNRIRIISTLGSLNHLNLSSDSGILIKDGRILETLPMIDTILFDKTGTLTEEQPKITQINAYGSYREDDILLYAATAESQFSHPIAKAVLQEAENRRLTLKEVKDSNYRFGYGITVNIDNKIIKVGSLRHMQETGISVPQDMEVVIERAHSKGHSIILVSIDNEILGIIEFKQSVRPQARQMLQGLRARGIQHIYIVSGDQEQPTKAIAESLSIDRYFYEILPEDKAAIVEQLQKEGRNVCFVGDEINDSLAMKKANISISLKGASSVVNDISHVVLMDEDLARICDLFDISIRSQLHLVGNLVIVMLPTAIIISGAYLFGMGIQTAVLVKNIGMVGGIANTMRPLKELKPSSLENNEYD